MGKDGTDPAASRPAADRDPAITSAPPAFSDEIAGWLRAEGRKTLGGLGAVFAERAFAVTVLLLMFVPALPLPTGGISHAFEIIAVLIAGQMVIGRDSVWLPRRWENKALGPLVTEKAIPFMTKWIRRFERLSRRRGGRLLELKLAQRIIGVLLIAMAITALLAPPFSGLDTLPAAGAVIVCLGFILRDVLIVAIGTVVGAAGAVIIVTVGATLLYWIRRLAF
jgi:hypothetical protein